MQLCLRVDQARVLLRQALVAFGEGLNAAKESGLIGFVLGLEAIQILVDALPQLVDRIVLGLALAGELLSDPAGL